MNRDVLLLNLEARVHPPPGRAGDGKSVAQVCFIRSVVLGGGELARVPRCSASLETTPSRTTTQHSAASVAVSTASHRTTVLGTPPPHAPSTTASGASPSARPAAAVSASAGT